ncbi:phage tail protein [Pectobacterium wasabiae]|uniref:Phage tail protein n=1 Tax=Pectobacterium wasabiae TaxID=55208 RepID=A0AAW3EDV7_9GAMM|nr:tail fiber protein [Pectobacterium wasabiae]EJS94598.1 Tail Collar domain protein [Pectobacterium wasabiae CFBP 3304]KFX03416.1 phage tail protein [Pectobacterium wasabiae]KGA26762.1 phage tail protein [Pectobacterium wasabiae]
MMKLTKRFYAKSALAASLAVMMFHAEDASACAGDEPYIGSVCYMVTSYCPSGYLPAAGQSLSINGYQALYSLIGNLWGGSQQTGNFTLPDLRGRSLVGSGQGAGLSLITRGQSLGAETATLAASNIAPHTHPTTQSLTNTFNVLVPATTGNLNVTAALPLAAATPATGGATPTAGANFLTAISATVPVGAATQNASFKGPYQAAKPGSGSTLPADVTVTGVASLPSFTVKVPETVVGNNTGGGMPFSVRDPAMGLTACIAVQGIYPINPN